MPITTMYYMRPDENWALSATVSGTVDADYDESWLTDGLPRRPVRAQATSPSPGLSLTLTGAAGEVGLMVVGHHNLIVPVTIGGNISATITPDATRPPNDIPLNPFKVVSPANTNVTSLTLSVSGNDEHEVIGEFAAGVLRELTPVRAADAELTIDDFAPQNASSGAIRGFEPGRVARTLRGTQYYDATGLADLQAWWEAQRANTLPSILIPHPDVNDAWFVTFVGFRYRPLPKDRDLYLVELQFQEFSRDRW